MRLGCEAPCAQTIDHSASAEGLKEGSLSSRVKAYLRSGASVNSVIALDEYGRTLLFVSVEARLCRLARTLLNHGANVNQETVGGLTPLHRCVPQCEKAP